MPPGLNAMRCVPRHILRFLASYFKDMSILSVMCRKLSPMACPNAWRARIEQIDPEALLSAECTATNTYVKTSKIRHKNAGLGLFAGNIFGKGECIGHYYGTIVYKDMGNPACRVKTFGEGMYAVSKEAFLRNGMFAQSHRLTDRNGRKHPFWISPVHFCAGRFMNDPRYITGDLDIAVKGKPEARRANVKILPTEVDPVHFSLFSMIAIRNIAKGEELYASYGEDYLFRQ